MKRKIKLISTIASMALVLAIMTFSALAAKTVNVSISNNVSYTVSAHVKATISATKTAGENTVITSGGEEITPINFTGDEKEGEYDDKLELGDVVLEAESIASGLTVVFSYTITIENKAEAGDDYSNLKVTFTALPRAYAGGYGITVTFGGTYTSTGHTNEATLAPGQTHTMTVTFTGDANVSHNTTGTEVLNSSVNLEAVLG